MIHDKIISTPIFCIYITHRQYSRKTLKLFNLPGLMRLNSSVQGNLTFGDLVSPY